MNRKQSAPRRQAPAARKVTAPKEAAPGGGGAADGGGVHASKVRVETDGSLRAPVPAAVIRDLGGAPPRELEFRRARKGVWQVTLRKGAKR